MRVTLLNYTAEPEKTIAMAAKLCYGKSVTADNITDMSEGAVRDLLERLMSYGHATPFEHASFTFLVEGISRATSHELVRHRIASYSQRSQRYCSENESDFTIPETIEESKFCEKYIEFMKQSTELYSKMLEVGIPKEDARMVLPNAMHTKITVTMNARSLMHFFNMRCCDRAQWEIRKMAFMMLKECKKIAPVLFKKAGASCTTLGYCPEGDMCCGKAKTLNEIIMEKAK